MCWCCSTSYDGAPPPPTRPILHSTLKNKPLACLHLKELDAFGDNCVVLVFLVHVHWLSFPVSHHTRNASGTKKWMSVLAQHLVLLIQLERRWQTDTLSCHNCVGWKCTTVCVGIYEWESQTLDNASASRCSSPSRKGCLSVPWQRSRKRRKNVTFVLSLKLRSLPQAELFCLLQKIANQKHCQPNTKEGKTDFLSAFTFETRTPCYLCFYDLFIGEERRCFVLW